MGLAAFTVLFGTRGVDANERHHGVVSAIAVEALVKLFALIGVGIAVVVPLCFAAAGRRRGEHNGSPRLPLSGMGKYGAKPLQYFAFLSNQLERSVKIEPGVLEVPSEPGSSTALTPEAAVPYWCASSPFLPWVLAFIG